MRVQLIALAPVAYPKRKKFPDGQIGWELEEPIRGLQEDEPDS
jgi:hypothetical protein